MQYNYKYSIFKSALQKSIRCCEVNESRYFAREMMNMGMPRGVFKRLMIIAAEDVGLADPGLILYVRDRYDEFKKLLKKFDIAKSDVANFPPDVWGIIDRAVIAAALSYKSRLLPHATYATLLSIYKKESFNENLSEYIQRFTEAVEDRNEVQALYNAFVAAIILNSKDQILDIIKRKAVERNSDLIQKWAEEYRKHEILKKEILVLSGSILMLCRKRRFSHKKFKSVTEQHLSTPIQPAQIPDRAYDKHTSKGAKMGRGLVHFFNEGATVQNERFSNTWEMIGRTAYYYGEQIGLGKAKALTEAINAKYIDSQKQTSIPHELPFCYKKAVLTQPKTRPRYDRAYTCIVEFNDGTRKFVKGPFKSTEMPQGHITCNEVKRKLESKYLHPIRYELKEYNAQSPYLVCDEIGRADLGEVDYKKTEKDGIIAVLKYDSNDVVPDPLAYLSVIDANNRDIWIELMVNYCFRWVFGIPDAARRNLMLQKSTRHIYSIDETGIERANHETVWGVNKKPRKEIFKMVKAFVGSANLNDVLTEVERWKGSLDLIRREVVELSRQVEGRIDKLLNDPKIVFDI